MTIFLRLTREKICFIVIILSYLLHVHITPVPPPHQDNLPPDWRRIAFVTTGLAECRHSVLAFGAEVRSEHPPALVTWIQEQAKAIIHGLG